MEAQKAQNLITYREEIYNRPKREWFLTKREKKQIKDDAKAHALGPGGGSEAFKKLKIK